MSKTSSLRRKLTGALGAIRMRRQLAGERRAAQAKAAAAKPAPPAEPKRPDIYDRASPEAQKCPPILRQPASPEAIERVRAKAEERRLRRNQLRLSSPRGGPQVSPTRGRGRLMSYANFGGSPYDDGDLLPDDDDYCERDEDEWGCCFPEGCLMAYADHMKGECHTVEMLEAYYADAIAEDAGAGRGDAVNPHATSVSGE